MYPLNRKVSVSKSGLQNVGVGFMEWQHRVPGQLSIGHAKVDDFLLFTTDHEESTVSDHNIRDCTPTKIPLSA